MKWYKGHAIWYFFPGEYAGYQDDGFATQAIARLYSNLPDLERAIDGITQPSITSVTISAPSSRERNVSFTVSGTVKDQFGVGVGGASVALFDNGSQFATVSTNSSGGYSRSTSIGSTGIHELAARSGGVYAWTDITITAPDEPEDPIISNITISAPSSHVEDSPFTVSGRVTDQFGDGVGGITVAIYVNGTHVSNDTPDSQGYYSLNLIISSPGIHTLMAFAGTKSASRNITITEAAPEPPVITRVTIDAPTSMDAGVPFVVSGYVLDQYNVGMGGVTVYLYDNGSLFDTTTTFSSGYYLHPYSISQAGVHELAARADSVEGYRDITITEVAPAVDGRILVVKYWIEGMAAWENLETYPTPANIGDNIHLAVAWVNDGASSAVGHVIAQLKSPRLSAYQPSAVANQDRSANPGSGYEVRFAPFTLNEIGTWEFFGRLDLDGTPFVDTKSFTFGVQEAPVGILTTTTISAPSKAAVNERFNISGILNESEAGIPIPNQPINHSYNGRSLGSSTTGVDGNYLKEVSIPEAGTWTLKSEFPGTEALQTSRALVDAFVAATPIETAILIAGPIVTGLALVIYGSR